MKNIYMILPISGAVGITSVSLGVIHTLQELGVNKIAYSKLFHSPNDKGAGNTAQQIFHLKLIEGISTEEVNSLLSEGKEDDLIEKVIHTYDKIDTNALILEGSRVDENRVSQVIDINIGIAQALNAQIILVDTIEVAEKYKSVDARLYNALETYDEQDSVLGFIYNKVNAPKYFNSRNLFLTKEKVNDNKAITVLSKCKTFSKKPLAGCIPWDANLATFTTYNACLALDGKYINEGEASTRRVRHIAIATRTVDHIIQYMLPGALFITGGDRDDILIATALKEMNKQKLAGVILTNNAQPNKSSLLECNKALSKGLPVFITKEDTYTVTQKLYQLNNELLLEDIEIVQQISEYVASHINKDIIKSTLKTQRKKKKISPVYFRYQILEKAKSLNKTIILPEGKDHRIIEAATFCHKKGIAKCILLGEEDKIRTTSKNYWIDLPSDIEIINPFDYADKYAPVLHSLRKKKGMTESLAIDTIKSDIMVLATLFLYDGKVDGMVGGASTSTARTIMPAFQLIKTKKDVSLVSSVFFMLLPDKVVIYGDCAVNPNPSSKELAEIAIQSADMAKRFGMDPKVAMISYSTGSSGSGEDVDKVIKATTLAKQKCPELLIDGPLQYDAASTMEVAKLKAPTSPVAGNANVFIFPDLNTGNTTYKAVQRSANVVSIGPILQGLNKPVNDLSRGALVNDIIYTIAITAIQSS